MLTWAANYKWLLLVIAVTLVGYGGYTAADWRWEAKWATQQKDAALAIAKAESREREKESALQLQLYHQKVSYDQRLDEMQRNATVSAVESDGLRQDLAGLRDRLRSAGEAASNTGKLPPATRAALVLSDLYAGCSTERSELAISFDAARQRGLEVEQMYDRARGQ